MSLLDWLREHLLPITPAEAQRRVDSIDHELARLRARVAALPAHERAAHAQDLRTMITEHAQARNTLSEILDDRTKR